MPDTTPFWQLPHWYLIDDGDSLAKNDAALSDPIHIVIFSY